MKEQKMGIDYFCIETDIKDDDKVFALRYRYATMDGGYDVGAGYAAFGRLVDVLADIYRDGFAAEMNLPRMIRLSQQLGMSLEEFDHFMLALPQNQPNAPLYPAGGAPGSRPGALPHFGRPRYLGPPPRARSTAG